MLLSESKKNMAMLESLTTISLPEEMLMREDSLIDIIGDLEQKIAVSSTDSVKYFENKLFEVNQEMEDYMEQIRVQYPKFVNDFYDIEYVTTEQIQAVLGTETVFVEY